ncbi:MAG: VTT domain-containing protein [Acidobacteriota bacterium]
MAFILGIKDFFANLGKTLIGLGAVGLFAIALLDSAFVPLPGGPDAAMIILSYTSPAWMPLYALAATLGSTIGCAVLYLIARRAGASILRRVSEERRDRVENLLGRYDMLAVMVPAVLPPPFPFKPFVLCAGVFKLRLWRFVTAIFIGRAARFLIEGWLAITYKEEAADIIRRHGLKVLIGVGAVLLVFLAVKFYRLRRSKKIVADEIQSEG